MITTKSRYGMRAMVQIAKEYGENPVSIDDIAQEQSLSDSYLFTVMSMLKAAGLVRSVRGRDGGYVLRRRPSKITALDIVTALDGPLSEVPCIEAPGSCGREQNCETKRLWEAVHGAMAAELRRSTVADLLKEGERE